MFLLWQGDGVEGDRCGYKDYAKAVESARSSILKGAKFRVPAGFFSRHLRYGCVLIAFDVDQDGKARNVEIKNYFPLRVLEESARRSLSEYQFKVGDEFPKRRTLLFETDADWME